MKDFLIIILIIDIIAKRQNQQIQIQATKNKTILENDIFLKANVIVACCD